VISWNEDRQVAIAKLPSDVVQTYRTRQLVDEPNKYERLSLIHDRRWNLAQWKHLWWDRWDRPQAHRDTHRTNALSSRVFAGFQQEG
jgi:hypothetical protein